MGHLSKMHELEYNCHDELITFHDYEVVFMRQFQNFEPSFESSRGAIRISAILGHISLELPLRDEAYRNGVEHFGFGLSHWPFFERLPHMSDVDSMSIAIDLWRYCQK